MSRLDWLQQAAFEAAKNLIHRAARRARDQRYADVRQGVTPGVCRPETLEARMLLSGTAAFQPQASYPIGKIPLAVVSAELTHDGHADLIVANAGDNTIGVLLGSGDGTFSTQTTFATATKPQSIAVADVNNDGIPDILVANFGSNNLGLFLGNGDGTFKAQQTIASGRFPASVALTDINGDGKPDIVVANFSDNNVGVLLGNGDGTFQAQKTFAAGSSPNSVAVQDINGDSRPDIVVANNGVGANSLTVLLGNGDGTFQSRPALSTGARPVSVVIADVNGDGKPDLVAANNSPYATNSVSVFLGNGDGTFQGQQMFPAGHSPYQAVVADLNGDGKPDIATVDAASGKADVLLGNGDGTFQAPVTFGVGGSPQSLTLADVNGDGAQDLIAANYASFNLSVLLNNPNPGLVSFVQTTPGPSTSAASVTYTLTFNKSVSTPMVSDFALQLSGTVAVGSPVAIVAVSPTVFTVTVNSISGTGTLGLNLVPNNSIVDSLGTSVSGGFTGPVYTITKRDAIISITGVSTTFDGSAHAASGTATGTAGEDLTSLLHFSYENLADNSISTTPPTDPGTYEVFINFDGNATYNGLTNFDTAKTIVIQQGTPTLNITGAISVPDGNTHAATGTATGANGVDLTSLLHLSYQLDVPNPPAPTTTAPSALGTNRVLATFDGNTDYAAFADQDTGKFIVIANPSVLHPILSGKLPAVALVAGQKIAPIHQMIKVTNTAAAPYVGIVRVDVVLSPDPIGSPGDPVVGTVAHLTRIKPAKTGPLGAVTIKALPAGLSGTFYLVARLTDNTGAIASSAALATIRISPPFVDLLGVVVKLPPTGRAGKRIVLTINALQSGNIPVTGIVPVALFLSITNTMTGAVNLGTFPAHAALRPGKTGPLHITATIPGTTTAGNYFIIAQLDPNNALNDSNLANNVIASAKTIVIK